MKTYKFRNDKILINLNLFIEYFVLRIENVFESWLLNSKHSSTISFKLSTLHAMSW